jgi:hypothetical protein
MPGNSTYPPRGPKPFLPAWLFSVLIHTGTLLLLCAAIQPISRGAPDAQFGSMGIVLHPTSAVATPNDGDGQNIRQTVAIIEDPSPPNLLAAAPTDTNESTTTKSDEAPESPKPAAGTPAATKKPPAKQTKSSGKASGRPTASSGRAGSGSGSGYAQVSVFGVQGRGSKFIYVFDRSASMEGVPLAAAKKQLVDSLQSLESVHQFHIIFFNTKIQSFDLTGGGHRIAFASDRNKKLAANFVGGITADGGTDRMLALREALNFAPDVVFFLTDDDDPMSPSELAEIARSNRKAQAAICVIEFGKTRAPVPNNSLAQLAHDSGGQYGYVDTSKLPVGPVRPTTKLQTK